MQVMLPEVQGVCKRGREKYTGDRAEWRVVACWGRQRSGHKDITMNFLVMQVLLSCWYYFIMYYFRIMILM